MDLTKHQIEVIKTATKDRDYCTIAHRKTMNSLVEKGYAEWTNGFGYKYSAIIELTEKGKKILCSEKTEQSEVNNT